MTGIAVLSGARGGPLCARVNGPSNPEAIGRGAGYGSVPALVSMELLTRNVNL
jgi:hypothetical protein